MAFLGQCVVKPHSLARSLARSLTHRLSLTVGASIMYYMQYCVLLANPIFLILVEPLPNYTT